MYRYPFLTDDLASVFTCLDSAGTEGQLSRNFLSETSYLEKKQQFSHRFILNLPFSESTGGHSYVVATSEQSHKQGYSVYVYMHSIHIHTNVCTICLTIYVKAAPQRRPSASHSNCCRP